MAKEFKNEFSWSVSRDNLFRECPRKYYFNYYGSWGGWRADADEKIRGLYVLKNLINRAMWVGDVVHRCIAVSLKNLSFGIPVLDVENIISITLNGMRQDFRNSRSRLYYQNPKKYRGFFEHEYDMVVSDEEWKTSAERVETCLRTFYSSAPFEQFKNMSPGDVLEIEEFNAFTLDDTRINLKLDFACREEDRIAVWDWKTGKSAPADSTIQMASYAWYAGARYNEDPSLITARQFNLLLNKVQEQALPAKSFEELFSYIRGSTRDMRELLDDPADNLASEQRFSKVEKPSICLKCNFLKICKPDI